MAGNWGGAVPTALNDAYIINGGTASITISGELCQNLFLGDPNSGNSGTLNLSLGNLSALANEYVGNNGAGTFNQNGGVNTIYGNGIGYLYLANNVGSSGSYNLSGTGRFRRPP